MTLSLDIGAINVGRLCCPNHDLPVQPAFGRRRIHAGLQRPRYRRPSIFMICDMRDRVVCSRQDFKSRRWRLRPVTRTGKCSAATPIFGLGHYTRPQQILLPDRPLMTHVGGLECPLLATAEKRLGLDRVESGNLMQTRVLDSGNGQERGRWYGAGCVRSLNRNLS